MKTLNLGHGSGRLMVLAGFNKNWKWCGSKLQSVRVFRPRYIIVFGFVCVAFAAGVVTENVLRDRASPVAQNTSTQSARPVPKQDFERRYDAYSPAQRAVIERHVAAGLSGVGPDASEYEKAAALSAYVYRTIERREGVYGGAVDILTAGGGVCGGMVATLSEMLHSLGIKSRYAFTIGGPAAHSMVEVYFPDGTTGLFDPYHGIAYYDIDADRPVSITDIDDYIARDKLPVLYALKNPPRQTSSNAIRQFYSTVSDTDRLDYSFLTIFAESDSRGIANSGFVTTIRIALTPGDVVGTAYWTPSASEPKPWRRLSLWKRTPDEYLSWAYIMGQTGLGYLVKHAYTLDGLEPGKGYVLRLYVANAYAPVGALVDRPTITIQPVFPFGEPEHARLENRGYSAKGYEPQVVELSFEAETSAMTIVGQATGNIVLQGVELAAR